MAKQWRSQTQPNIGISRPSHLTLLSHLTDLVLSSVFPPLSCAARICLGSCILAAYRICFVRRAGFIGTRRYVGTWLCTFGRTAYTFFCCPRIFRSLSASSEPVRFIDSYAAASSTAQRKKAGDSTKKGDTQKKNDKAKTAPKHPPANGKKKPAAPPESVPPVGTAQRVNKRKPLLADVDPDASSSDEEEEQPPKKKKRNASPARKQKEAAKKKGKGKAKDKAPQDAWVDQQDPAPEEEENSEIPKKGTIEWHRWNLPKLRARWTSDQYKHFKDDIEVVYDDAKQKFYHKFTCKTTGSTHVRPIGFSGGSNLLNHVKTCEASAASKKGQPIQPKITDKIPRTFRKGMYRFKLLRWVTRRHRPDAIIEDDELIDVFTYLNPDAKPTSRQTLRRDIHEAFKMTREELKKLLEEHEGRFNLIFDCWTAGNGHEFLGVLLSFVHNGKLFVVVLDMIE
ncbi:hypothetical protein BDZ89DRAFT_1142884 [Hymenopellis radicata]|nr:hypothetical protein BDZ89DRAFT_1142884 [Hymenopellis radicata]